MQDLNAQDLATIVGGASSKNDQITQQLTALQTSIKDVASSSNNNGNSSMMTMMMMMAMRPQGQTVVASSAPAAAAPGPVVNINTRVR